MRKLFLILFLFGLSNSFAQGKVNGVINLARLILAEPNYAVRLNVSDFYIIQPEISYRFSTIKGGYLLGEYFSWDEAKLMIGNEYKFNSLMLALTQGIKTSTNKRVDLSVFYRLNYNNDMGYYDYGCGKSSSCPVSYYSGGGMKIKKYGVKLLFSEEIKRGIEVYSGFSLYNREMIITYNKHYSEGYGGNNYNELQTRITSSILPGIHLGLNLVF